ncbi:hypothetical protein LIER_36790 [Lithospermum erythrorhizon]|uniref:Uncharacterized protein n=1 Tax=Lithospermum erythrorhizon TaxID=34254 RepID=A0AAV3PAX2_LITER
MSPSMGSHISTERGIEKYCLKFSKSSEEKGTGKESRITVGTAGGRSLVFIADVPVCGTPTPKVEGGAVGVEEGVEVGFTWADSGLRTAKGCLESTSMNGGDPSPGASFSVLAIFCATS